MLFEQAPVGPFARKENSVTSKVNNLSVVPVDPADLQEFTDELWTCLRHEAECRLPL